MRERRYKLTLSLFSTSNNEFFLFMHEKGKTQGVDNINKDYSHITH